MSMKQIDANQNKHAVKTSLACCTCGVATEPRRQPPCPASWHWCLPKPSESLEFCYCRVYRTLCARAKTSPPTEPSEAGSGRGNGNGVFVCDVDCVKTEVIYSERLYFHIVSNTEADFDVLYLFE